MTGSERLQLVREALKQRQRGSGSTRNTKAALAALSTCVVLTAEEAHSIAIVLEHTKGWHRARMDAIALLTPDSP